jgi:uncharacterized damage-inducible protein DinB
MQVNDVLKDAFGRIRELVHHTVSALDIDALVWRPDPHANTIAWLVWHLTRIEDDHVAGVAGHEQVWTGGAWAERFGLAAGTMDHGYGHSPDQVAAVRPSDPRVLTDYHDEVAERTQRYLEKVDADELDRVVDRSWDPPVTAGVRLVSVIADGLQHIGQAAYVRGMYDRRSG